ncbi:protein FAR1-RELATED SEQUENCE 8-like [Arachis hypogaea]|uniref:protein FAR1-RELATED SEQUENCE 8-like n=1 Tax=Arachis hypogaea TaxID=3818 RepID=UPI003B218FCE
MNAAIVYLEGKAAADPMSMARYNLTEEGMLENMFWVDGPSRVHFQHFGDVVAFDSTYKKNKYNRPLVIFSGSNNHKQTTIFGFGLVLDETIGSYKWMLENLLEVMCGKLPSVVVTDGDESMIAAVREVLPRATHRLCAWHLHKNVTSNTNEQMFRDVFAKWLYANMEVEEFEGEWAQVAEHSMYGVPVMTTCLDPVEQFAASVYTKVIFTQVKKEIDSISVVNFVIKRRVSTTMVYMVEEYGFPGQNVVALYDPKRGRLVCRCGFWEKEGFPCRHMFFVMKHEHLKRIPERLILSRWRKDVKTVNEYTEKTVLADEQGFLLRHGALHAASQWILFVGSKNDNLYKKCMSRIRQICCDLQVRSDNDTMDKSPNAACDVRDPTAVLPNFNLHADQDKWLEEGDDCGMKQDAGAYEGWDHVIGTAQSQTRNIGGVGNTVDWNIEVINLWLGVGDIAVVTRSLLKVLTTRCSLMKENFLYVTKCIRVLNFLGLYFVNLADARNRAAASKLA